MTAIVIIVPGEPVPKARARTVRGHSYTPERTLRAQQAVAWEARRTWKLSPMRGSVRLGLVFRCGSRRRTDIDNLAKLVMDALNGVVWEDDSQIEELHVYRFRGNEATGTTITVSSLTGGTT